MSPDLDLLNEILLFRAQVPESERHRFDTMIIGIYDRSWEAAMTGDTNFQMGFSDMLFFYTPETGWKRIEELQ